MMQLPFFSPGDSADIAAWRHGQDISRGRFAGHVLALAEQLPARGHILNHCEDRYRFLVAFVAALLRGQVSLFPPNKAPRVLQQLKQNFPDVYCLRDEGDELEGMENCAYPDLPAEDGDVTALAIPADRIAAIAFTSGSTGEPRPYTKTWGGFVAEAEVAGRALGLRRDEAQHRYLVATVPAQHMYGLITSIILPARFRIATGADRPFYPEDIRKAVAARSTPPILVTTPVHIRACVREQTRLPETEFILSSTAPLHAKMAADAERLFNTRVMEFYGSTETGAIALRRQAETDVWHTFDDIQVTLNEGSFEVSAPYFYQSPMVLGDSVEVLDGRNFKLHGRDTELIKVAGKRAMLGDLNHQLLSIEGVEDGTFFLPDGDESGREARLIAFVVAPGMSKDDIVVALRERIDEVFLPRPLKMVNALPRNATGKLPRGNLVQLWRQATA
ncbi:MAG: xanthomonadin biosynthesis 3-hydroxybenozate--AMP ligase XanA2 [Gammaproteobacteria bacterium]|nr:MAG: xanthomonadin biosynthesis 3-hydroxybenozate--AMP ligase XanA2 [Gammaproteobacteria bacterium]